MPEFKVKQNFSNEEGSLHIIYSDSEIGPYRKGQILTNRIKDNMEIPPEILEEFPRDRNYAYITAFYPNGDLRGKMYEKDEWGKGYGARMMDEMIEISKRHNAAFIQFVTKEEPMKKFADKRGFVPVKKENQFYTYFKEL